MTDDDTASTKATIKAGRASEVTSSERRAALDGLAEELRRSDSNLDVGIEITEYIPGRRGLDLVEQVAIFIGSSAGAGLIGAVATDVYNVAKDWARKRFGGKDNQRPERVIVRDEHGHTWTFEITKEGETEEEADS